LRLRPLLQVPVLLGATLLGVALVVHAVLLQNREIEWLRASTASTPLRAAAPDALILPDPQGWNLQARWLALQAVHADDARHQVGLLRRAAVAAQRHLLARPQWSMAWLNWASISAQLYPGGREWQAALLRALSLGDRGWAFQQLLGELMLRHESFMAPETRAAVERSLLSGMAENGELASMLWRRGLFSALCAEPISSEARAACAGQDKAR
jgi:hypothetical protein